jgi:hypothetical protein
VPDLVARKIKDVPARLYRTAGYLERIGSPRRVEDLAHADFINIDSGDGYMSGLNAISPF